MKLFLILSLCVAGLAALVLLVGLLLPETREARAGISIAASPEQVMAVLTDVARQPDWRDGIASVAVDGNGWVETTTRGERITFVWTSRAALTLEMTFRSDAGYHGTWRADLVPAADETHVSVVERATIDNPVRRVIARLFFDPEVFAAQYLAVFKVEAER